MVNKYSLRSNNEDFKEDTLALFSAYYRTWSFNLFNIHIMKKLREIRWYLFGAVLITALLDLWFLPGLDFGAGFILACGLLVYAGWHSVKSTK